MVEVNLRFGATAIVSYIQCASALVNFICIHRKPDTQNMASYGRAPTCTHRAGVRLEAHQTWAVQRVHELSGLNVVTILNVYTVT